ncbi:MAG TPA: lipoprotein-releasing ABC transporter permease subunit [Kiloniellaceae bacterium]
MFISGFERLVALRYLRPRRQEGFVSIIATLSMLGIAIGVAALIIVMAVMNGFRQELLAQILGVNGHLTVFSDQPRIDSYDDLAQRIGAVDGVVMVTPQIQEQVVVTMGDSATGALVRGMKLEDIRARPLLANNIVAGSLDDYGTEDGILLGARLARQFGVTAGDRITLLSPSGTTTVMGTVPRMKTYRIAGLFEVGMAVYDEGFIYVPLQAAQLFFRLPGSVNAVEVYAQSPDDAFDVGRRIQQALGPGYRIVDWQRSNASFFGAIQTERNVMFIILSLIILVASFNVLSGQVMLVKNKGRDIAILRTMGATRGMILRIFFATGAAIGVVGTALGFVIGLSFAANIEAIRQWLQGLLEMELFPAEIYFLSRMPAEVDSLEVTLVVVIALALSFLAPLYPAWRAARLDPVEALRYE